MLTFRPAIAADYLEICELITTEDELFRVYPNGNYPLTIAQLEELSKARLELTIAEKKGHIIGFANLYNYRPNRYAFVGNIILKPTCRGRGYGRQLVEHMLKIASEKLRLPEIRISVFADNTPALLLYHSLGFRPYDMEERNDFSSKRKALIHLKKDLLD